MAEQDQANTSLNYSIYVYVNPTTHKIDTIQSDGTLGTSEYDPKLARWVALGEEDTWRVRDLGLKDIRYEINWDNDNDFDFHGKNITLQKYSDGTLDENYLKKNAILVNNPIGKQQ